MLQKSANEVLIDYEVGVKTFEVQSENRKNDNRSSDGGCRCWPTPVYHGQQELIDVSFWSLIQSSIIP